ncbi:MAG: Fic family protein [Sphaerochaeta sp.]|nr:Fic family protein [Sphaerochaeta sp.]
MKYVSVAQIAQTWAMSERGVRNYCAQGKIEGAFLKGKAWHIPENARKPERITKQTEPSSGLSSILKEEKQKRRRGGIYHKIQIDLTFNSNHMEGSKLSHDQTRYIYETNTIGLEGTSINVDDIVETANHFRCIDHMIDRSNFALGEPFIKQLHALLKNGTSDSRKDWFEVGEYKKLPNEIGGHETTLPEHVAKEIRLLLDAYDAKKKKTLDDIIDFHVRFERIHPFQDGNGRVGRLIMFKECLRWNIVPFIISDSMKMFYYRGLNDWNRERGFLRDTCLSAQDTFKRSLDYFRIPYDR